MCSHVCFRGKSRLSVLALRISASDPKRTFAATKHRRLGRPDDCRGPSWTAGQPGPFRSWRGNGRPFLGLLAVTRNLPRRKRCEHSLCFVLPCSFQSLVQTQNPRGQQQRSMRRGSDKLSLAKPRNMLPAKDRRSQVRPRSTLQDSKGSKGNIPSGEPSKREN